MGAAVMRRPASEQKPWRDKTPVLCWFEYEAAHAGSIEKFKETIVIKVEFSDQIPAALDAAIKERRKNWREFYSGPVPMAWTLLKYLPKHGKQNF